MNLSQLLTPPEGFGKALQTFSPLALAMAQGIRSGQGAQAYMPQGIAAMMANKDRADLDAKNEKLTGMLDTFGLTPAERALLDTMDLGGKQSYLANLIASRRTAGRGRQPTEAEMAAKYLGGLGPSVGMAPQSGGLGFSTGTLADGVTMPPSQNLSFGTVVQPPGDIEKSPLPPSASDNWVFPPTFPNADPMANSVVAQSPALATRVAPPVMPPQERPQAALSFGARPQMPAQAPQSAVEAELAQVDRRIMQAMREAQAGNVGAAAALKSLAAHRDMLVDMMPAVEAPDLSEAEQEIARLESIGIPRDVAIRIKEGVYAVDRDPIERTIQVVDLSSGQMVWGGQPAAQPAQPSAPVAATPADPALSFGEAFSDSPNAFGVEGALRGLANMAGDVIPGAGTPFPETQQTQADFNILRENLLNDIASGYQRQPPSWLLQEIRNLTPQAGRPFEGPDAAQSKLRSIGRMLEGELRSTEEALRRRQSPQTRADLEARQASLQGSIRRIQGVLGSFGAVEIRPEVADRLKAYE